MNWKVKLYTIQQFNPEKCFDKDYEKLEPRDIKDLHKFGEIVSDYSKEVRILGL